MQVKKPRTFGTTLREQRLNKGLSQRELATLSGVGLIQICLLERGAGRPTIEKLAEIARALELDDIERYRLFRDAGKDDTFNRFTAQARKALALAQEEAQRFNHNYIGTEHLLLGLVREGDGVAAHVLSKLGVSLPKVRSAVEFIIGRAEGAVVGDIGLTPRAKKVIELAVDEARRLDHHYIGSEHLLLGLVREGKGIASGVLESLGVNATRIRAELELSAKERDDEEE